jgi:hypothetical protein
VGRIAIAVVVSLLLVTEVASAQSSPSGTSEAGRFTIGGEALPWWFKRNPTPPLINGGTLSDTSGDPAGGRRDELRVQGPVRRGRTRTEEP